MWDRPEVGSGIDSIPAFLAPTVWETEDGLYVMVAWLGAER